MADENQNSPLTLYGIKNCDTIKKARRYLESHDVAFQFHDYRADGLDAELLQTFIDKLGFAALLNTRGTTWRKLPDAQRNAIDNADAARELMLAQPAIIKRPLLCDASGSMLLGFSETTYQQFIQEKS
ncbi:ArsC family reductase [Pantoea sp. B65]|uniref:ArsC family reductase n=1 Tax=Pantoea sp. B65 TaxID=2813359 RepID=UPI0039B6315D